MNQIRMGAIIASAGIVFGASAQLSEPVAKRNFSSIKTAKEVRYQAPARQRVQAEQEASFTVETPDAHKETTREGFDSNLPTDWSIDHSSYVEWSLKQIASAGDAKSFSAIDPDDVASLYVEGPYNVTRREISSATTGELEVPQMGSMQAYIGFSQNWDDYCRLIISVSTDNFETEGEDVWNSKDETGDPTWRWHPINVSLEKWAGSTVKIRFTYSWGAKDEMFKSGGYLGDFAIDGLAISGLGEISGISVMTGEKIQFKDITAGAGNAVERRWSFPGGVPATSTEVSPEVYYTLDGDYDVSLEVLGADNEWRTATRTEYVHVTGTEPVAHILPPASFKYDGSDACFVAPLAPVTFQDASEGYPTNYEWTFMGHEYGNPEAVLTVTEPETSLSYGYLHEWPVALEVSNQHGSSIDMITVAAEYEGFFSNMPAEPSGTNFDMGDWGLFPGSNTRKMTAFGEKFSAPSRPMVLSGAYVYFTKAQADELYYQIQSVTVRVYAAGPDGKPGEQLDFGLCDVIDLNVSSTGSLVPTAFEFSENPVVTGDFFIVVDDIPEFTDTSCVAFAMTPFGDNGGTAWMCKDGEWMEVSSYFPAGSNHTNFCIKPYGTHSVMASLEDQETLEFNREGGSKEYQFFSYLGYTEPEIDADWLRITSPHGDLTVETLTVEADAMPQSLQERTANIKLTDGMSTLTIPVVQNAASGIIEITPAIDGDAEYYNLQGIRVDASHLTPGIYVRRTAAGVSKVKL